LQSSRGQGPPRFRQLVGTAVVLEALFLEKTVVFDQVSAVYQALAQDPAAPETRPQLIVIPLAE
jgi:hypothetical protein